MLLKLVRFAECWLVFLFSLLAQCSFHRGYARFYTYGHSIFEQYRSNIDRATQGHSIATDNGSLKLGHTLINTFASLMRTGVTLLRREAYEQLLNFHPYLVKRHYALGKLFFLIFYRSTMGNETAQRLQISCIILVLLLMHRWTARLRPGLVSYRRAHVLRN